MNRPVIAIGLDAAEPSVLEKWMAEGHLNNLRRLRENGAYGRLKNFEAFSAETPWTTFLTGCSPHTTGYWSPLKFKEGTYEVGTIAAYDFEEYPPFYALGEDFRVAIFDMPQICASSKTNGIHVGAWGAHSPQVPSASYPESLFQELVEKHGNHPGLHKDYAVCVDLKTTLNLVDILKTGIARRAEICRDLLQREPWNLFLTVFGEAHAAGHNFWQLSQPDHPLYKHFRSKVSNDPMLEVFEAIDEAIGRILEKAPADARVVVFSAHGMGANTMDLPSTTFLPELLYRLSFPGSQALLNNCPVGELPEPITKLNWNYWERHIWGTKTEKNPLRKFLRTQTPTRVYKAIEDLIEPDSPSDLAPPLRLKKQTRVVPFEPASWYAPIWSKMKAFALPSFSEGYVRINLKGREPEGIVAPEDYDAVCEELTQKIYALRDARTGIQMAKEVIKTRKSAFDNDPKLPDADLVVVWQEEHSTDTVESPEVGRIGPAPHYRAGSHRPEGFILATGQDVPQNVTIPTGHALDLAPTILNMMDAPIAEHLEGSVLPILQESYVTA